MAFSIPQQFLKSVKQSGSMSNACTKYRISTTALRNRYHQQVWRHYKQIMSMEGRKVKDYEKGVCGRVNSYPWIFLELEFQIYHSFIWLHSKVNTIKVTNCSIIQWKVHSPRGLRFSQHQLSFRQSSRLHRCNPAKKLRKLSWGLDMALKPFMLPLISGDSGGTQVHRSPEWALPLQEGR